MAEYQLVFVYMHVSTLQNGSKTTCGFDMDVDVDQIHTSWQENNEDETWHPTWLCVRQGCAILAAIRIEPVAVATAW